MLLTHTMPKLRILLYSMVGTCGSQIKHTLLGLWAQGPLGRDLRVSGLGLRLAEQRPKWHQKLEGYLGLG